MGRNVTVGVAGATGALGREVLRLLDEAPWRPDHVQAFARASTTVDFVEYGEERLTVDALEHFDPAQLDLLIIATPAEAAPAAIDAAVAADVPVVDLSGSQLEDLAVPLVVPWLNAELLRQPRSRDVVAVPSAAAMMIGAVLSALAPHGRLSDAEATVMLPASHWGKRGSEELSGQVVALFNSSTPPRTQFPEGFAFDLMPEVGERSSSGWTRPELRLTAEVARLSGQRLSATLVGVPVFNGVSATLSFAMDRAADAEWFRQVLLEGGLQGGEAASRRLPRPRRVDGERSPAFGRLRTSLDGTRQHVWLSMDNVVASAAAAVGVAGQLLRLAEEG